MAENKTKPTRQDVTAFIAAIEDQRKRADCLELLSLMGGITGEPPVMWGPGMIGFGNYHYKYASGREGDFFLAGFSPRKRALSIYVMSGFDTHPALMEKLGKFKTGKSCLYVSNLDDIDRGVLTRLLTESVAHMRKKYAAS